MTQNAEPVMLCQNISNRLVYYCTLGRGMAPFVTAELKQVAKDVKVLKVIEGKIFFSVPLENEIVKLRTAERILVHIYHQKQDLEADSYSLMLHKLHKLLEEQVKWDDGVRVWSRLQGLEEGRVSARFNIRISGQMKRMVNAGRLATTLSSRLKSKSKLLSFAVRGAQVSIDLHISDAFITAGVALSAASVAAGGVEHGLRSTTAAAMVMCLNFECENSQFLPRGGGASVVLDPMCGKGSILGALLHFSANTVLGVDNDLNQLRVAIRNNCNALIVQSDSRRLPFASSSVDQVVCDLPFGLKYNKADFKQLITSTLSEICRVMVPMGRVVFLFSRSERQFLESAAKDGGFELIKTFDVMLGALEATVFVFFKTPTKDLTSCEFQLSS